MKTHEAARGKWQSILSSLGVDPKILTGKHVPCPFCGGKDRFRFDNKHGAGTWFCTHCGSGAGIEFVKKHLNVGARDAMNAIDRLVVNAVEAPIAKERSTAGMAKAIERIWREADAIKHGNGTLTEQYLRKRVFDTVMPDDVRHHAALTYFSDEKKPLGEFPTMVALVRDVEGKVVGMHRTYLSKQRIDKSSVDKPKKVMACGPLNGAAVRLLPMKDNGIIGVAEGIETALAAHSLFGNPVWAALNANGVETFEPPPGTRLVVVYGDNDRSATGQVAAYRLKQRMFLAGVPCLVELPKQEDTDWADVLKGE